jgi:hypothetical protein
VTVRFEFFFRLQSSKGIAISAITPSATPTPTPAVALVLSPLDDAGVVLDVDDIGDDAVEIETEAEVDAKADFEV